ncbi:MAG: RluA family pseudouridine synthase [Phycisphaerae bacterium]
MSKRKVDEDEVDEFEDDAWEEIPDELVQTSRDRTAADIVAVEPKSHKSTVVEILFEDEHLLVINKPSGLDSNRGQFAAVCVLDVLEARMENLPGPLRLVHRLDRETSGLMVLAKTAQAQKNLSEQWETRAVEKTYLVIVHGVMQPREGVIDLPLKKTENQARPVMIDHKKGKPAATEYDVVDQFRQFALVEAQPVTGRMHQIRVHFAAVGCGVLCDSHYGLPDPLLLSEFKRRYKPSHRKETEKPLIARLALHANLLKFKHPISGATMEFKLNPPKDFSAAVKQLGKYGR